MLYLELDAIRGAYMFYKHLLFKLKSHNRSNALAMAYQRVYGRIRDNFGYKSEMCRQFIGASAHNNSIF